MALFFWILCFMNTSKTIDSMFKDITNEIASNRDETSVDLSGVTFWIPSVYKEKYRLIQSRSKRKLSKHIAKLIVMMIDKVEIEDETKSA